MRPPEIGPLFAKPDTPDPVRIRRWLREIDGLQGDGPTVERLATVGRLVDVQLLAVFLTHAGWFLDTDSGRFGNPDWYVTPYPQIGGQTFTALLESRHERGAAVIDIYEDRNAPSDIRDVLERRGRIVQSAGHEYREAAVSALPAIVEWLERALAGADRSVPHNSTRWYGMLIAPGLVWKPLGKGFTLRGNGPRQRQQRLAHWLREERLTIQPELLPALAMCDSEAEVRFLVPFLHPNRGKWTIRNGGIYRGTGSLGVQISPVLVAPTGPERGSTMPVAFVISRFADKRVLRTVIDLRPGESWKIPRAEQRQRSRQVFVESLPGHAYQLIDPGKAAEEGKAWADILDAVTRGDDGTVYADNDASPAGSDLP